MTDQTPPVQSQSKQQITIKQTIIERGALEAWRASLFYEPTEPLREKGGALDPEAWCMKAAKAIYADKRPPGLTKNLACPQWLVDRIAEAMSRDDLLLSGEGRA